MTVVYKIRMTFNDVYVMLKTGRLGERQTGMHSKLTFRHVKQQHGEIITSATST